MILKDPRGNKILNEADGSESGEEESDMRS